MSDESRFAWSPGDITVWTPPPDSATVRDMTTEAGHQPHCSNCGSTAGDDIAGADNYTSCCNEPVCIDGAWCHEGN
jgi:hypothetical protein